jgi:hypothetical protein
VTTAGTGTTLTATCPATHPFVLSGGWSSVDEGGNQQLWISSHASAANAWTVQLNNGDSSWSVYAYCAK